MAGNKIVFSLIDTLQPHAEATDEKGTAPDEVSCVKRRLRVCMLEGSNLFDGVSSPVRK